MSTRLIHGIKYLESCDDNNLKELSLENNVYFTLRDIFWNISATHYLLQANEFNEKLTNNICYDDRTDNFQYTDVLNDKSFINKLSIWLNTINISDFEFEIPDDDEDKDLYYNVDLIYYIKFDDWLRQFENLKQLINLRLDSL